MIDAQVVQGYGWRGLRATGRPPSAACTPHRSAPRDRFPPDPPALRLRSRCASRHREPQHSAGRGGGYGSPGRRQRENLRERTIRPSLGTFPYELGKVAPTVRAECDGLPLRRSDLCHFVAAYAERAPHDPRAPSPAPSTGEQTSTPDPPLACPPRPFPAPPTPPLSPCHPSAGPSTSARPRPQARHCRAARPRTSARQPSGQPSADRRGCLSPTPRGSVAVRWACSGSPQP